MAKGNCRIFKSAKSRTVYWSCFQLNICVEKGGKKGRGKQRAKKACLLEVLNGSRKLLSLLLKTGTFTSGKIYGKDNFFRNSQIRCYYWSILKNRRRWYTRCLLHFHKDFSLKYCILLKDFYNLLFGKFLRVYWPVYLCPIRSVKTVTHKDYFSLYIFWKQYKIQWN